MKGTEPHPSDPEIDRLSVGNRSPSMVNSLELAEMSMEGANGTSKLDQTHIVSVEEKSTAKESQDFTPQHQDHQVEKNKEETESMPPNSLEKDTEMQDVESAVMRPAPTSTVRNNIDSFQKQDMVNGADEAPQSKSKSLESVIDLCDSDSSTTAPTDTVPSSDIKEDAAPATMQSVNETVEYPSATMNKTRSEPLVSSNPNEKDDLQASGSSEKPQANGTEMAKRQEVSPKYSKKEIAKPEVNGLRSNSGEKQRFVNSTDPVFGGSCIGEVAGYKGTASETMSPPASKIEILWKNPSNNTDQPGQEKTRVLVPKKRKRPLVEVDFDVEAWEYKDGRLIANTSFKRQADAFSAEIPSYVSIFDSEEPKEDFEEGATQFDAQMEIDDMQSRRTRANTRVRPTKTSSRVGAKYQATNLPKPSTYEPSQEIEDYTRGYVLYDPIKADLARQQGERIEEFLESKELELNVKYLMMESLHNADYNVKNAMSLFIQRYKKKRDTFIEFSATEQKRFDEMAPKLLGKKDFKTAAAVMKRTKECIMVHYYLWKRNRKDYDVLKEDRKKESDYCWQCQDGGHLIVCDLCRRAFHLQCHNPPLKEVPVGDWYCMRCNHASPARLRRLSVGKQLDTSAHAKHLPDQHQNASAKKKAVLCGVHRELFPVGASNPAVSGKKSRGSISLKTPPLVPSGMIWDSRRGVWLTCDSDTLSTTDVGSTTLKYIAESSPEILSLDDESESRNEKGSTDGGLTSDSSFHGADAALEEDDDFSADDDAKPTRRSKPSQLKQSYSSQASDRTHLLTNENILGQKSSNSILYEIYVPITEEGLLLNIVAHPNGGVCFSGYRKTRNGGTSDVERRQLFRSVGDRFIRIDGKSCEGKTFQEVKNMLREHNHGQTHKHLHVLHELGKNYKTADESMTTKPSNIAKINTEPTVSTGIRSMEKGRSEPNGPGVSRNGKASGPTSLSYSNAPSPMGSLSMRPPQIVPANNSTERFHNQQIQQRKFMSGTAPLQPVQRGPSASLHAQTQPFMHGQPNYPQSNGVGRFLAGAVNQSQVPNFSKDRKALVAALEPMRIPDLLIFLSQRGIHTAQSFLSANSSFLAGEWAKLRQVPWDVALDFIGAVRLQVRQFVAQLK